MIKVVVKIVMVTALIFTILAASKREEVSYKTAIATGDIIFHTSQSAQSALIELATKSSITHCGVIFKRGGQFYVYEASSTVKYTPIETWIKRGKGGKFTIKRLKDRVLSKNEIKSLKKVAKKYHAKRYDPIFNWSDEKIYCSELVRKLFVDALDVPLGELVPMSSIDF